MNAIQFFLFSPGRQLTDGATHTPGAIPPNYTSLEGFSLSESKPLQSLLIIPLSEDVLGHAQAKDCVKGSTTHNIIGHL